ncbi:MAG: putative membrane protein [Candidatus Marinamargulisbacteria bacterium]|jgi:uncharacterized membrane protein
MPNIHPLLIHFPIAFLMAAFVCEVIGRFSNKDYFKKTAKWTLLLGTISLGIAAFTGWLGHKTVSHSESSYALIEQHQRLGFITLGIFVVLVLLRFIALPKVEKKKPLIALILIINLVGLGIMTWGAHLGGRLVFEMGVGVQAVDHSSPTEDSSVDAEFEKLLSE